MTDEATTPTWVPDACTLPAAAQPLRRAEFDDLFATALHHTELVGPQHLRLTLTGADGLEASVADLAARESECCSFFVFTIARPAPDTVTLDVEVPPMHTDVLAALADRATRATLAGRTKPSAERADPTDQGRTR